MSGDRYLIKDQQGIYFLTFTVVDWVDAFTRKEYKMIIVDSLKYCCEHKGLEVFAWVLMSNHLHLIVRAKVGYRLSDMIRDFKKFTAKAILTAIQHEPESRKDWMLYRFEYAGKYLKRISKYKFWKDDNHAILLDSNEWLEQKIDYIHQNPVKALLVSQQEDYVMSSAIDYAGGKGMIPITLIE